MKKLYLLLLFLPFLAKGQTTYTSVVNGDWNTATTWSPNGIPGINDTVIINNTVTDFTGHVYCANLIVNSGGTLNNSTGHTVTIDNLCEVNTGGKWTGNGNIGFRGPKNGTFIKGGGDFSGQGGTWYFQGNSAAGASTDMIDASVNLTKNYGSIILYSTAFNHSVRILNFGKVQLVYSAITSQGTIPCSWTQEANSYLSAFTTPLPNATDTLIASASGNCVSYNLYNKACSIKQPLNNTYYTIHVRSLVNPPITCTLSFDVKILDSLVLYSWGSLDLQGHNVTIGGNWINNITAGSLKNNTGTVTFNGSSAQTIGGTHTTRFANVTVSGSGTVNIATSCGFTGALTMSGTGNLASTGGKDTLISTASATARVAQITGSGTISAGFIIERYDGRTIAQYESISSPVQGTTLGDWDNQAGFWMSGTGGNDGNVILAGKTYYSVKKYNEVTNKYDSINTDSYILTPGLGIYLWMGNSLTAMSPFTYNTTGIPTQGTVNYAVTKTTGKGGGFNLLGNPYPSPIDWAKFKGTNATLQSSFYLFEQDGNWHAFTSGTLPMEQGFGIVTNSATTLHFSESHKTATDASLLRTVNPGDEANAVTFTLSNDANTYSCPTIISFSADYVPAYDMQEDALFIKSPLSDAPGLFTTSNDTQNLCLNSLPDNADEVDVPLTALTNIAANYTLTVSNLDNLFAYNCVCLIDKQTGAILNNFEDSPSYTFTASQANSQQGFILRFRLLGAGENCNSVASVASASATVNTISITPSANGAMVNFRLNQPENAVISVYTVTGEKVMQDINANAYNNSISLNLPSAEQLYIIRVVTQDGITVKKLYR